MKYKRIITAAAVIIGLFLTRGLPAQNHEEANYDESAIPPYTLPKALVCNDGTPVEDKGTWEGKRRQELLEIFSEEIYGRLPDADISTTYNILEEGSPTLGGKAIRRQVEIVFRRDSICRKALMLMYFPATDEKVPVFLHFNFQGNQTVSDDPCIIPSEYSRRPRGNQKNRWPVGKIIDAGYGLATIHYFDFYLDRKDNFTESVMPLFGYRSAEDIPDNGGMALSAWAWGYSRAMDYLEIDPSTDASRVIVAGHSRLGKAALWAGAQDTRFAVIISNDSGCGGAALSMRRIGETVNEINKVFPHWFCRNFRKYSRNEDNLPVDQHELLALAAPRPLYVASAEEDRWADPKGEFLSLWHASEVYSLYGYKGMPSHEMPEVNCPVMERTGYHIRTGIHDVTDYDWDCFIKFADKWLKPRYAVTTLSVNYMREEPDFTAELGSQALMGTPVKILDESGYWRKIQSPDPYTAWCVDLGLKEMSESELENYIAAEKVICTADYSTVWRKPVSGREKAGKKNAGNDVPLKVCDIVAGDLLLHTGKSVRGFREVRLPSGETGYVPEKDAAIFSEWAASRDPSADNIISTALDFIGLPYMWGGTSLKGVDCSGLTRMVWFMNGILLPRNASAQANAGLPVEVTADTDDFPAETAEALADLPGFKDEMLRRISHLQKGDLVFFGTPASTDKDGNLISDERISHVGIYIGDGKFIHASRLVRISSLIPGSPDYYELSGKMIKARRIAGNGISDGVIRISDSPAYFPQR